MAGDDDRRGGGEHSCGRQAGERQLILVPSPDQDAVQHENHARDGLLERRYHQSRHKHLPHVRGGWKISGSTGMDTNSTAPNTVP